MAIANAEKYVHQHENPGPFWIRDGIRAAARSMAPGPCGGARNGARELRLAGG